MARKGSAGLGVAVAAALLLPASAGAALERYQIWKTVMLYSADQSPFFRAFAQPEEFPFQRGLIQNTPGGPELWRLRLTTDGTTTVDLPGLSGFLFASRNITEGPADHQTGVSGDSSTQIDWGTVTGWAVSGRNWCNSEPATICLLAGDSDEATTPTQRNSPFYNIGTWYFHGTGFTSQAFVWSRLTTGGVPGENIMYRLFGPFEPTGVVPTLPLAGIAVLGAGILLSGVAAARRR